MKAAIVENLQTLQQKITKGISLKEGGEVRIEDNFSSSSSSDDNVDATGRYRQQKFQGETGKDTSLNPLIQTLNNKL